jgi:hypothetical protein
MRLSAVEEYEIDELPPAVAKAFEKYIAACLAYCWNGTAHSDFFDSSDVDKAESRFIGLLNHQREWRWGGSTWRIGQYGVERVAN